MPEKHAQHYATKQVIVAIKTEVEINYLLVLWGVHSLNSQMTILPARMHAGKRIMCGNVTLTCLGTQ